MTNHIDADAAKLAGLQIDTLQKVRNGQISLDQWQMFNNLLPEERQLRFSDNYKKPVVVEQPQLLLEIVSNNLEIVSNNIPVVATTTKFIAKDAFVVNTGRKAKVKISYIGDNFKEWFGSKTEEPFTGSTLDCSKLKKSSVDGSIIAELGGEAVVETTLTEIYDLMLRQPNGEKGILLNDGWANIFYVRDTNNIPGAVGVRWHGGGWRVGADSIGGPGIWDAGSQVFSRNSLAA